MGNASRRFWIYPGDRIEVPEKTALIMDDNFNKMTGDGGASLQAQKSKVLEILFLFCVIVG